MIPEVDIFKQRACAKCGAKNGGCKRWRFVFSYNRSGYLCAACVEELGGTPAAVTWLESHALYDNATGRLIGFGGNDND